MNGEGKLTGATPVPNIVLWPATAISITAMATLGGIIIQDRGRVHTNTEQLGELKRLFAAQAVKIDDHESAFNQIRRDLAEIKQDVGIIKSRMP